MHKKNLFIIIIVLAIIGWTTNQVFFSNEIGDLAGGFTEVSSYRNENNTGPIQRIYAVTVKDTANAKLIDYGNSKPHSKYGNTKVFFFVSNADVPPKLFPGEINFEEKYKAGCFALYEKSAMGNFGLLKNPYRK